MKPEQYRAFITQLSANLQADERARALILVGSTADQSHAPDEWSDHDFFVITTSGTQEHFRTQFDWLPDYQSIVLTVRETEHGLKVLYDSGHLLEFAIFDAEEVDNARVNDYSVAFDRADITGKIQQQAVPAGVMPYSTTDRSRDMKMVLCLLVVGAGRVRRGEAISGQLFIRSHALRHLLQILAQTLPADDKSRLDNLDPFRRVEQVFPELGAEINAAISRPPLDAALGLLDIYEQYLCDLDGFSVEAVATVRRFLL